jgi:hypothetical protein
MNETTPFCSSPTYTNPTKVWKEAISEKQAQYYQRFISSASSESGFSDLCVSVRVSHSNIFITIDNTYSATPLYCRFLEDLNPFIINDITYHGRKFHFKNQLEVNPAHNETGELLCLKYTPLGIHVFADSRNELYVELAEQICMLWDEYACESDENLTSAAIRLKKNLLDNIKEV